MVWSIYMCNICPALKPIIQHVVEDFQPSPSITCFWVVRQVQVPRGAHPSETEVLQVVSSGYEPAFLQLDNEPETQYLALLHL